MRTFWGAVLGLLLFFPGTVFLKWLVTGLGLYQNMTLTESCLVMIMILLTIVVVQQWPRRQTGARSEDRSRLQDAAGSGASSYRRESARSRRGRAARRY